MAFLLSKAAQLSKSHVQSQYGNRENLFSFTQRSIHIEPGAREKALLADDPILRRFKSYKKEVRRVKRIRDVLTIIVITGCCYKTYVRATMKREAMDLAEAEEAMKEVEAQNAGI